MGRSRQLAGFVVLSALVNILIAWAAAIWAPVGPGAVAPLGSGAVGERPPPLLLWQAPEARDWPNPTVVTAADGPGIAVQVGTTRDGAAAEVIRAGWPWYSFRAARLSRFGIAVEPASRIRAGLDLPVPPMEIRARAYGLAGTIKMGELGSVPNVIIHERMVGVPRCLPLEPLWPGFLANSLLGAAILGGTRYAMLATRRAARRRAGGCGECGYPRSGLRDRSVCPECGADQ